MKGRDEYERKLIQSTKSKCEDLPQYVEEWMLYLKANDRTAASIRDFIYKISSFLYSINPNTKEIKPEDITYISVVKYLDKIKTREEKNGEIVQTSDSYRQNIWTCLNNFLDFMYNSNYIEANFIRKMNIHKPKNHDLERINKNRVLLTEDDFKKIIDKVLYSLDGNRKRDACIILLLITTGMRRTALTEINVGDIDFENNTLTVVDKGNKTHEYFLNELTMSNIQDWIDDMKEIVDVDEDSPLFISQKKNRISSNAIEDIVKKYTKKALGYPLSPHKLRAGFCTILYDKTGDIEFVRRAVGHSNTTTTQRYIVTDNKEKKEACDIMSKLIYN